MTIARCRATCAICSTHPVICTKALLSKVPAVTINQAESEDDQHSDIVSKQALQSYVR
jgi:hypothetical protein